MQSTTRRQFLGGMGRSLCSAAVGFALADQLGFAETLARLEPDRLRFGNYDALVDLMQATPPDALLPAVVELLKRGKSLEDLVAAAALANARAHGGTYYDGYHALMALAPSLEMSRLMPAGQGALPVLKVLHRNTRFIDAAGRAHDDAMKPLAPADAKREDLVAGVRARDTERAEQGLAVFEAYSPSDAYKALQEVVRDDANVHRVVLSWRAYDLLRLTGQEHALTMLRQSVRFCVDEDTRRMKNGGAECGLRELLPQLVEDHHLSGRAIGETRAEDARIEQLGQTIFASDRPTAARAVAAALEEGVQPEDVGAALSLAATKLLLNDPGLKLEQPGKPIGSVHGASVGVHASDAANAWRSISRTGGALNAFESLIAGAFHTAGQSQNVGELPNDHDAPACELSKPDELLAEIGGRIRERDQKGACQATRRYTTLNYTPDDLFALLLPFAVSEDGALHAEKYFRTAQDEHRRARPAHQPQYLIALTRVMASHYGFPAPGLEDARKLLAT